MCNLCINPPMVWPFKIWLLAKWLSICLNLLKHSIIFCYCTTTPFKTLWKDLKVEKLGYGMFVQRVVSPFKTFHRSLLSDSFLTFQSSKLERFDNSMGKCTVHKRVKILKKTQCYSCVSKDPALEQDRNKYLTPMNALVLCSLSRQFVIELKLHYIIQILK